MTGPWHQTKRSLISDVDETALNLIEATYAAQTQASRTHANVSLLSYYLQNGYCKDHDRAYESIRNLKGQVAGR
jgi:hypothetical protein